MDRNKLEIIKIKMQKTAKALEKNNYVVFCVNTKEEALNVIKELIPHGASVGAGGSVTLSEIGAFDFLRSGSYNFLDRFDKTLNSKQKHEILRKSLLADIFITSTNAITENGELFNVDGNANRVAAMLFGPDSVIVVAGYNKIVPDIEDAEKRVKQISAPANCVRLAFDNPCTKNGSCVNCSSKDRICADTVIMGWQRYPGRVKVILIAEELGY